MGWGEGEEPKPGWRAGWVMVGGRPHPLPDPFEQGSWRSSRPGALQQLEAELQAFQEIPASCSWLARSSPGWARVLSVFPVTQCVEVNLPMGGPSHPLMVGWLSLQTGASTQGPWPPWRPASGPGTGNQPAGPSTWLLAASCTPGVGGEAGGQVALGRGGVLPTAAPACWPPLAGGKTQRPDGPQ